MPFGLSNAPATFQRLMENCFGDMNMHSCLIYLDDIVVFSRTFEEHIERLEKVFERLVEAGLKLSPAKCNLFQKELKYLGHIVSPEGIATDPKKVECVREWPVPENLKQLQSFLGFVGYYRRFIKDFSKISRPMYDLFKGSGGGKKKGKIKQQLIPFHWSEVHRATFDKLVSMCCEAPVLAYTDYSKPFLVHTDASLDGHGAVLYQEQEGKERVIAYASRGLTPSQIQQLQLLSSVFQMDNHGLMDLAVVQNWDLCWEKMPVSESGMVSCTGKEPLETRNLLSKSFSWSFHHSGKQKADCAVGTRQGWSHGARAHPIIVATKVFWPRMTTNVAAYIQDCPRCLRRKHPIDQVAPLENFHTTQPMELVCIDYLTLKSSKGGYENILLVTDHFTKYSQAYPRTRLLEQQPKSSLTTSLFIMVSQRAYLATRGETLKASHHTIPPHGKWPVWTL